MKKIIFMLAGLVTAGTLQAGVIVDTLDNTNNISYTFGNASVSDNGGSGIVTLLNTSTDLVDTGMDWQLGGASGGSMNISNYTGAGITPYASVAAGYYNVSIVLYDTLGDYVGELLWIDDTQDTSPQTVVLADLINPSPLSESDVASWAMRIRVNLPHEVANSGFEFTEISVTNIPEPASLVLIGISGCGVFFARRLFM
ncbi:PEP-CTERM sorting domain-containing protein [Verrucomicrobia bacterium S94]|nr:PEP-CTERM sorting domain-containing protein [Verrucomicrobia bacterium S94]